MKICMVNGSPKAKDSCSGYLLGEIEKLFKTTPEIVQTGTGAKEWTDALFAPVYGCDAIVFAFPLYVDGVPSHLLRFLEAFERYLKAHPNKKIIGYAVVNCGFIEGKQNAIALDIIENFCVRAGLVWGGGLGIGGGPFLSGAASMPWQSSIKKPIYLAMLKLADAAENGQPLKTNLLVTPKMHRRLYILAAHLGWRLQARQNHLRQKDLYAR